MKNEVQQSAPAGAVYALGLIGAAIYFIMHSAGFWGVIMAILKAIVWPAVLVYKLLAFIGA
ncbi:MAG: hypothetical protein EOM61_00885 [Bacteroidia bacterium]|jgi:hypothetical protein|uniref:Uncharacterized protein n=1 Tax=bioreactor metagenome TaxID=1076179 RepID=A0A645BTC5_9ZZZZ|nr:hypothetical protein [Rikenellaceae bacterium]NCB18157.1 hypothetical protein [Bacteroidia bacterium]